MEANSLDVQTRIMSSVIPIVSSSPPPLDDDADFKWDDDDDEYGNFTSAPTVSTTSDSSFEPDRSNFSKGSPKKSGSKTHLKEDDLNSQDVNSTLSENILADNQNSQTESRSRVHDCDSKVTSNDEDFQGFAYFDKTESLKSPSEASGGVDENKPGPFQDLSLPINQCSANGSVDDVTDEDDFQEFAHFNDTTVSEGWQHSADDKSEFPELSQGENKTHSNNVLTISSHSNKESPDENSEAIAADCESAGSFHLKNTDSIYSSVSTVDSGVFSADMSPSSHQGEVPDICLNVNKEGRLGHSNDIQQTNSPTSSSVSAGRSLIVAESLEASEELKDGVSFDKTFSGKDTSKVTVEFEPTIDQCDDNLLTVSSKHSSQNHHIDLNSSDTADGRVSPAGEENHVDKLSGKAEPEDDSDRYDNHQHSTEIQRIDVLSRSSSPTHDRSDVVHAEKSFASPESSNLIEQVSEDENCLPVSGCDTTVDHDVGSIKEGVFSDATTSHPEDELRATKYNADNDMTVIGDGDECNIVRSVLGELAETFNSDLVSSPEHIDNPGDACCDIGSEVGDCTEGDVQDLVTPNFDSKAVSLTSELANSEPSLQTVGFTLGASISECGKPQEDGENVDEVLEDTEFGDFSFNKGQTIDDCHEVPPITFRTSICEDSDEKDADEFNFGRERPSALVDEDDNGSDDFGAFGTATKDISRTGDSDGFGDFDSATDFQSKSSASDLNKRDDDEDDFGDFGKSEPGGDDADWADFGPAPVSSEGSDSKPVNKVQGPVSASLVQSKVQTLREVVVSCFPETADKPQKDTVLVDGPEKHSSTSDSSMNPSKDDEGPLPLETVVDLGLCNALEAKQQTWAVVQHPAKKDPKVRLWTHLKDVDSCHALMYGWHTSHCSKEVYATLHIDTQNILFTQKKQAVPFFASGLGILEPIRGGGGASLERKKEKNNNPVTPTTLLDINKTDYHQNSVIQDIPPVDFDWNSSGLTNPLTANTLDLDFLVIQGSNSYEKTSVFKTESQQSSMSGLQPIEEILKKTTPTAKLATNEVLSPEAARVLKKMPDLSFMLSRVLMFPVKQ